MQKLVLNVKRPARKRIKIISVMILEGNLATMEARIRNPTYLGPRHALRNMSKNKNFNGISPLVLEGNQAPVGE